MSEPKVYKDYKDYTFYFNRYNDWQDFMSIGNAAVIKANEEFPNEMYGYTRDVENPMNNTDWLRDDSDTIEKFDKGFYTKFLQSDLLDNEIGRAHV